MKQGDYNGAQEIAAFCTYFRENVVKQSFFYCRGFGDDFVLYFKRCFILHIYLSKKDKQKSQIFNNFNNYSSKFTEKS